MPLAPESLLGLTLETATGTSDCCFNHDFLQQKRIKDKGKRTKEKNGTGVGPLAFSL
jgi:hypothetical protein